MNFGYGLPLVNKYEALTHLFWTALVQFIRMGLAQKIHSCLVDTGLMSLLRQTAQQSFANFVLTTYNTNQVSVQAPLRVKISDGFCSLMFISNVDGDGLLSYFYRGVHVLWLQSLPLTYVCFVHNLWLCGESAYEMGDLTVYTKASSDSSSSSVRII